MTNTIGIKKHGGHNASGSGIVREVRDGLGFDQKRMAAALGLKPRMIQKYERAGVAPASPSPRYLLWRWARRVESPSVALQAWISETAEYFESHPPPLAML